MDDPAEWVRSRTGADGRVTIEPADLRALGQEERERLRPYLEGRAVEMLGKRFGLAAPDHPAIVARDEAREAGEAEERAARRERRRRRKAERRARRRGR